MAPSNRHYLTKAGEAQAGQRVTLNRVYYDDYLATMRADGYITQVVKIKIDQYQAPYYRMTPIPASEYIEGAINQHVNILTVTCEDTNVYGTVTNYDEEWEQTPL